MEEKKENKIEQKGLVSEFKPKIVLAVVGTCDLDTLKEIQDFFRMLNRFKVIYIRTDGCRLYITDKKPWGRGVPQTEVIR